MKTIIFIISFLTIEFNAYCQELRIVTEDYPPYNYVENGKIKGLHVEIMQAAMREADITTKIKVLPWARAYKYALMYENVFIFGMVRNEERENLFKWVGVINSFKTSFYKLETRKDITINTLADAKKYKIGAARSDYKALFLENQKFPKIDYVTNDLQNLRKLLLDRIDIIIFEEASLAYRLNKRGIKKTKLEKAYLIKGLSGNSYLAANDKTDDDLVMRFRDGLDAIKKKGIYEIIVRKYSLPH